MKLPMPELSAGKVYSSALSAVRKSPASVMMIAGMVTLVILDGLVIAGPSAVEIICNTLLRIKGINPESSLQGWVAPFMLIGTVVYIFYCPVLVLSAEKKKRIERSKKSAKRVRRS